MRKEIKQYLVSSMFCDIMESQNWHSEKEGKDSWKVMGGKKKGIEM